jgi:hypothetical protein
MMEKRQAVGLATPFFETGCQTCDILFSGRLSPCLEQGVAMKYPLKFVSFSIARSLREMSSLFVRHFSSSIAQRRVKTM